MKPFQILIAHFSLNRSIFGQCYSCFFCVVFMSPLHFFAVSRLKSLFKKMFEFQIKSSQTYYKFDRYHFKNNNKKKLFFLEAQCNPIQFDSLHKKAHKIQKRQTAKSVMAIKKAKTMVITCEISNGIKCPHIEMVVVIICCNFWFLWAAL